MRDFVIMTDSCCDLPAQMADELGVVVLPLHLLIGEETFANYLDGRELNVKDFYQSMRDGAMYSTSAANPTLWRAVAEPVLPPAPETEPVYAELGAGQRDCPAAFLPLRAIRASGRIPH